MVLQVPLTGDGDKPSWP